MSQSVTTLLRLRELILTGALPPGERISELALAEQLGASRTPVRAALARLEDEGLLEAIPTGGYAARAFSEAEATDAIELRGTLEGMAARLAAERGVPAPMLAEWRLLLDEMDAVVGMHAMSPAAIDSYVRLNGHFHAMLLECAGSLVVARQVARVVALPFASPSAFVLAQPLLPESQTILIVAQDQHRSVVEAVAAREGARAEALMREHARLARRNLQLALRNQAALHLVPGGALIQRRVRA